MIYLLSESKTPITVVEGLNNHFIAARISPNGSAHRIKSKQLEPELKCLDAFIALHKYAEEKGLQGIDEEISVAGSEYRLQASPHDAAHGIGYIKVLAQARTATSTASGKATPGMLSWQKYTAFNLANGWRSVALEWTRLFLLARAEQSARKTKVGKRSDNAAPGVQISGETVDGEVLPPAATETAVAKRSRGRPVNASKAVDDADWEDAPVMAPGQFGSQFNALGERMRMEAQEYLKLSQQAAWRAISIGVGVLKARKGLKHGEFLPWMKAYIPLGRVQIWRFTLITEALLIQSNLKLDDAFASIHAQNLLPAAGESSGKRADLPKPVQMVFDFIGERSLEEICQDLGISGNVKKSGGGKRLTTEAHRARTNEEHAIVVTAEFNDLVSHLRRFVMERREYVRLSQPDLKAGVESIKDCLKVLSQDLR